MLLDVGRWNSPAVLDRIRPRRYHNGAPDGRYAEVVLADVLNDVLGGVYWPWALLGENRGSGMRRTSCGITARPPPSTTRWRGGTA
jgi:hypothetical protein